MRGTAKIECHKRMQYKGLYQYIADPSRSLVRHDEKKRIRHSLSGERLATFDVSSTPSPSPPSASPDPSCKRWIAVSPAVPKQQAPDQSHPHQTPTASATSPCSLPDLNSKVAMPVCSCRTPTTTFHPCRAPTRSQCSPPDPKSEPVGSERARARCRLPQHCSASKDEDDPGRVFSRTTP